MYGNTLSAAGSSCGLKTEPASGKQPDVPAAVRPGASSSAAASGSAAPIAATTSVLPSSVSAVPSASGNATASFTSVSLMRYCEACNLCMRQSAPAQQSTNAAAQFGPAGIFGAVVAGLMAGL